MGSSEEDTPTARVRRVQPPRLRVKPARLRDGEEDLPPPSSRLKEAGPSFSPPSSRLKEAGPAFSPLQESQDSEEAAEAGAEVVLRHRGQRHVDEEAAEAGAVELPRHRGQHHGGDRAGGGDDPETPQGRGRTGVKRAASCGRSSQRPQRERWVTRATSAEIFQREEAAARSGSPPPGTTPSPVSAISWDYSPATPLAAATPSPSSLIPLTTPPLAAVAPPAPGASPTSPASPSSPAAPVPPASLAGAPPSPQPALRQGPVPAPDPDPETDTASTLPTQLPVDPTRLPSLDEIFRVKKSVITWVPPSACADFSREFTSIIERLSGDMNNIDLWKLFFMLPTCILSSNHKRARRPGSLTLTQTIKSKCQRWRNGEACLLWQEAVAKPRQPRGRQTRKQSATSQQEWNCRRAAQLTSEGQLHKAIQALTSPGLAAATDSNLQKMEELHPDSPIPAERNTDVQQIRLSCEDIKHAVMGIRSGTAGGPDGFKISFFKAAIGDSAPGRREKALVSLTRFCNAIASGSVPPIVRPFFAAATLFGVEKKDGGIRPIGCGLIIRRVTARAIMRKIMPRAASFLAPHQLAVGVAGGCEAIVHSVRVALDKDPRLWVLQCDLVSAYQLVNRDFMLQETLNTFPDILNFVSTLYGQHSPLFFGDNTLWSRTGSTQGCPVAGLLHAIVMHPIILAAKEAEPNLAVIAALADDATAVGTPDQLRHVVQIMETMGPERGLTLSTDRSVPGKGKTQVWSPDPLFAATAEPDPLDSGTRKVSEPGFTLLGSPVGSQEFISQSLRKSIEKIKITINQLLNIEDSQTEYCLLRACFGLSKIGYLLRTTDTSPHMDLLALFDSIMHSALCELMGSALSPTAAAQAALPVSLGGLGLREARDHGPVSYVASVAATLGLIRQLIGPAAVDEGEVDEGEVEAGDVEAGDLEEQIVTCLLTPAVMARLAEVTGVEITRAEVMAGVSQKSLSRKVDEFNREKLLETFANSPRDLARLAILARPHSLDYLNTVPCANMRLRPDQWVIITRFNLGESVYPADKPCPTCGSVSDQGGMHAFVCGQFGGDQVSRHNLLRDNIYVLARDAGLSPVKEARFLLPGGRRPADILVPNMGGILGPGETSRDLCCDTTVTFGLRECYINRTIEDGSYPAEAASIRKQNLVGDAVREHGLSFAALSWSSLGSMTPTTEKIITFMAKSKGLRSGFNVSKTISNTFKILSVSLQKANSNLLLNRCPIINAPNVEDFNLL